VAKRRTKDQVKADKIIRAELMELGEKVYQQAKDQSRVAKDQFYLTDRVGSKGSLRKAGGTLRDSVNYKPLTDTVLLLVQVYYGEFQAPNELQEAINDNLDDSVNIVVSQIMEKISSGYGSK